MVLELLGDLARRLQHLPQQLFALQRLDRLGQIGPEVHAMPGHDVALVAAGLHERLHAAHHGRFVVAAGQFGESAKSDIFHCFTITG